MTKLPLGPIPATIISHRQDGFDAHEEMLASQAGSGPNPNIRPRETNTR